MKPLFVCLVFWGLFSSVVNADDVEDFRAALSYFSQDGVAEPGLDPYFLDAEIYLAQQPSERCEAGVVDAGAEVPLASAEYREGVLFYGFTSRSRLNAWVSSWSAEAACFVSAPGNGVVEMLPQHAYLVMEIAVAPVLIAPRDFERMRAAIAAAH